MLDKNTKIFVTGHKGLVGSALVRILEKHNFSNILTIDKNRVDLRNQQQVKDYFAQVKPEIILHAAGTVGGILANNTYPADFMYDNLMMAANVIHEAYLSQVEKLIFLGSSCIYPKNCPQPIKEEYLLTGILEPTNQPYGLAKISGIELCHAYNRQYGTRFLPLMPTNLYGPNDNFNLETSHVLPALIRKTHEASVSQLAEMNLWGTGRVLREFLYVDDLADACLFFLNLPASQYSQLFENSHHRPLFNIGTGKDISIKALADLVCKIIGFKGMLKWDVSKPDGMARKLLDVTKMSSLGWQAKTKLADGIVMAYEHFKIQNTLGCIL